MAGTVIKIEGTDDYYGGDVPDFVSWFIEEYEAYWILDGTYSLVGTEHGSDECKYDCFEDCPNNLSIDCEATIEQSAEITVQLSNGCPLYNWSVAGGSGFSLEYAETQGLENTLYADADACGTATITVSDGCDETVHAYIRCTEGIWVLKETGKANVLESNCPYGADPDCLIADKYIYEGNKKWRIYDYVSVCDDWNCEGCDWIDWKDQTTGDDVLYPPTCGSPAECHGGTCENCVCENPLCCIYRYYEYSEWECA